MEMIKFALYKDESNPDIEIFVKYDTEEVDPRIIRQRLMFKLNMAVGKDHNFSLREMNLDKRD